MLQQGTQTALGIRNWQRHRPEAGPPMKKKSLIVSTGTRRKRRIQETLRSNQQSTEDKTESWAMPRFAVWKDAINKDEEKRREGVFNTPNQAASFHGKMIFRIINLHQLYKNLLWVCN